MWHKFPHNDLVATHKFKIKSKIILNWSLSNISNFTYYRFIVLREILSVEMASWFGTFLIRSVHYPRRSNIVNASLILNVFVYWKTV